MATGDQLIKLGGGAAGCGCILMLLPVALILGIMLFAIIFG